MTPAQLRTRAGFEDRRDELAHLWGLADDAAAPAAALAAERLIYADWLADAGLPLEAEAQRLLAAGPLLRADGRYTAVDHVHRHGAVSPVAGQIRSWGFLAPDDLPLLEAAFIALGCRAGSVETSGRHGLLTRRAAEATLVHALTLAYEVPSARVLCRALRLTWARAGAAGRGSGAIRTLAHWRAQAAALVAHACRPGDRAELATLCHWLADLAGYAATYQDYRLEDRDTFHFFGWPRVPGPCPPGRRRPDGTPDPGVACYEALQQDRALLLADIFLGLPAGAVVPPPLAGCRRGDPVWPESPLMD